MSVRVPILKRCVDDTVVDGTAALVDTADGSRLTDFRDLDGAPLVLEPGAALEIPLHLEP